MQLISKYDLFIFDWDNTLSKSTALVNAIHVLKKDFAFRYVKEHPERYRPSVGIKGVRIREEKSKAYAKLYELYSVFFRSELKLYAIPLLEFLKRKRKKVAIFSDAKTYRLFKETHAFGAVDYVDLALSADSIKYYKPNPTGLLLIMDRFRTGKSRSLYIGDMASDVLTAKFAGIDSCGIADGLDTSEILKSAGANHTFKSLKKFLNALQNR